MGNDCIVAAVVPAGAGPPPVKPPSAIGPKVQDNTSGKKAQARTYQDLLKDAYDEDTFEYYTNTELVAVQVCAASHCANLVETLWSCQQSYGPQALLLPIVAVSICLVDHSTEVDCFH